MHTWKAAKQRYPQVIYQIKSRRGLNDGQPCASCTQGLVAHEEESLINTSEREHQEVLDLEDHVPGSVYEFGAIVMDEKAMIDFASQYDPQAFHTDPVAATKSSFGGLVASGWHPVVLATRLLVDRYFSRLANLGSPGIDELRWLKPVRPGDELSVRLTILEVRPSKSKTDRGAVKGLVEVLNQAGEVLTTWKGVNIVLRRNAG